jgi:hypothetical protein
MPICSGRVIGAERKSARNAFYECVLDKMIGKFISSSGCANFHWFESSKASISLPKNFVCFDDVQAPKIQYGRMELQSPAAPVILYETRLPSIQ